MNDHCLLFSASDKVYDRVGGVHRIANHLRSKNWDTEVIDFVDHWDQEELKDLVRSRVTSKTKFFGFSYLFNLAVTNVLLFIFCAWVRENFPDIVLISGGQANLLDLSHVDFHIIGYGEFAIESLLKYLFSNQPPPTFDSALSTNKTKVINALHSYPAYPFRDPMISYEERDFIMPGEWGRIEFSRGCKFKCLYCNYPVLGVTGDYTRSAESAREQLLDAYDRFGIINYIVTDETFNDRTEKITKFADVVETLPWKPYFSGYIRPDLLISRPKDREELLRMGFLGHFYGIETFNHDTAKVIGKGMDPSRVQTGLIDIKNFFKENVGPRYRANIALIGGLPHETNESLKATKQWLKTNWLDQVARATVLEINDDKDHRRSDLSLDFKKYGYRQIPNDTEEFKMVQHGTNKSIRWENDNMTMNEAYEWAESIESIYTIGNHNINKIDPFFLSDIICEDDGTILDLDKKLTLVEKTSAPYYQNFQKFVETYKSKKLSL
jgi:radical SAM superfamily enzyme YgiQ (UPF0313 family)